MGHFRREPMGTTLAAVSSDRKFAHALTIGRRRSSIDDLW